MVLNLRPKCANPSCAASFEWLGGGRLFRFPRDAAEATLAALGKNAGDVRAHLTGHYWLCEHCSNVYTLHYEPGRGVVIRPLWPVLPAGKPEMHLPQP